MINTQAPAIKTLRKRPEFLAVRDGGLTYGRPTVVVQAVRCPKGGEVVRMGVTATKKLGGAVVRNRVKRRLRAIARELLPEHGRLGCDYVFIGRMPTATCPFDQLRADVKQALQALGRRLDKEGE